MKSEKVFPTINISLISFKLFADNHADKVKQSAMHDMSETCAQEENVDELSKIKVYKYRWVVCVLFSFQFLGNTAHMHQLAIIENIVERYYGCSKLAVYWSSIIFCFVYAIGIFPFSYYMDRMNVRVITLWSAGLTVVGAGLKVLSVSPDRFYLVMIGQVLVSVGCVLVLSVPTKLAAVWFPQHQVATASSICYVGDQFGFIASYILPPFMVQMHEDIEAIGQDMITMHYVFLGFNLFVFISAIFFFKSEPALPPSVAQMKVLTGTAVRTDFIKSMRVLHKNKNFIWLTLAYGLNVAIGHGFSTVVNETILAYYPTGEKDAGIVGTLFIIGGIVGTIGFGMYLDHTFKFKQVVFLIFLMSVVVQLAFTFLLEYSTIITVYISSIFLGIFLMSCYSVGLQFAAEITYPESEIVSSGILLFWACLLSIPATLVIAELTDYVGIFWRNIAVAGMFTLTPLLVYFVDPTMKRQLAEANGENKVMYKPSTSNIQNTETADGADVNFIS